jgi:hypothetical protein
MTPATWRYHPLVFEPPAALRRSVRSCARARQGTEPARANEASVSSTTPALRPIWERLTPVRALQIIVLVATCLALGAALLERLVDPAFETFGEAAWWAVSTVSTVGYGDVVPVSGLGRWIAACLMLLGVGLIPMITSIVVSTLISNRTRAIQADAEVERAQLHALARRLEAHLERLEQSQPRPE